MNTTSIFFDLQITTKPDRGDTILLYSLGEDLLLKDRHTKNFSRIDESTIRVEFVGFTDATRALAYMYNVLRLSKNYIAHTCAVTII